MTKQIKVTIKTETVGQAFGTVGVLYRGRKRLESTDRVYPYGFDAAARAGAEALAAKRGYVTA